MTTTTDHKHEAGADLACCVVFATESLGSEVTDDLAAGYKALGDPHRVSIVHMLASAAEPVCVVDIEHHLPIGQSTVSYHLKFLIDAGVLTRERRGRWMYYTIVPERLDQLGLRLADFGSAGR